MQQMEILGKNLARVVMDGVFWNEAPNGDDLTTLLLHFTSELASLAEEEDDVTLKEVLEVLSLGEMMNKI